MDRVDSHQHYWQPLRGDYGWMPMDDPILARQYRPADLEPSLDRWHEAAEILTGQLTSSEKDRVFGRTAAEFYRLEP